MISANEVVKKDGQLYMTGKAYNNRCIAEWLHNVTERHWRHSSDPRAPLAHLLMSLSYYIYSFYLFSNVCCFTRLLLWHNIIYGYEYYISHIVPRRYFGSTPLTMAWPRWPLMRCLFAMSCSEILQSRNGITRYFGIMERCPRFLLLESHYLICMCMHACVHVISLPNMEHSIEHIQECSILFLFSCSTA